MERTLQHRYDEDEAKEPARTDIPEQTKDFVIVQDRIAREPHLDAALRAKSEFNSLRAQAVGRATRIE